MSVRLLRYYIILRWDVVSTRRGRAWKQGRAPRLVVYKTKAVNVALRVGRIPMCERHTRCERALVTL